MIGRHHYGVTEIPIYGWLLIFSLLFIQGLLIFRDAQKRGENKWLWGLFGLLNVPSSAIIYYLVTRYKKKS